MDKFLKGLGLSVLVLVLVALAALASGTILYWLWEPFTTAIPILVEKGWVVMKVSWWQCVSIVWVFSIIATSLRNNAKKDEEK